MKTGRNISGAVSRLRVQHWRLLAALGEERGIHRVARRLGMTQPAASKLLREIEGVFEVSLFERTRRGVVPTASGEAAVDKARVMLGVLEGMRDAFEAIAGGGTGSVSVGVLAVAAPVLLPRAILRLDGRIRVRLEEGTPDTLLAALRRGRLDCVVGRMLEDEASADLAIEHLHDEPVVIACGPKHPLAGRRKLSLKETAEFPWILPPPGAPLRRTIAEWFSRRGLPLPGCRVESVSILANIALARESDTLVMLPGGVAGQYQRMGLIRVLPLAFESTRVSVATRRGEPAGAALAALLEAIRAVSGSMTPAPAGRAARRPGRSGSAT